MTAKNAVVFPTISIVSDKTTVAKSPLTELSESSQPFRSNVRTRSPAAADVEEAPTGAHVPLFFVIARSGPATNP